MTDYRTIADLVLRRFSEELSEDEQEVLDEWLGHSAANREWFRQINDEEHLRELILSFRSQRREKSQARVLKALRAQLFAVSETETIIQEYPGDKKEVRKKVFKLKQPWFRFAAAILILIAGAITYYFIQTSQSDKGMVQTTPSPKPEADVLPGSDRAILTLSNGQQVQLNNATSETITDGTLSIKNNNGQLSYTSAGLPIPSGGGVARSAGVGRNTMTTPKGGQYKLTLADGTKVWLNAASSITYPIAFTGKTREVTITGEAYFEVGRNREKPFIVKTPNDEITVLGTEFNVNAYADEKPKTSLLEGSVRISPAGGGGSRSERDASTGIILKPGQAFTNGKVTTTNTNQDIAWKNGIFDFNNVSVKEAMRQIARWYDVEIVYDEPVNEIFIGEIGRNLTLNQVLKTIEGAGVHFKLEGKILHVSG